MTEAANPLNTEPFSAGAPKMIRLSSIALLSIFFLAACGNAGDNTSDIPVIKDEAILQDPFSKLLPWDATRTEVQTTPSGLQYVVLKSGSPDGPMPGLNDQARVHYDGRLASDGSKFDSSYDRGQPCLLYTSPSPRDQRGSRMPSSA